MPVSETKFGIVEIGPRGLIPAFLKNIHKFDSETGGFSRCLSKNGNLRNIHRKFGQSVHELFLLVLCKMPLRLGVKFPYSDFKCRNTLCGLIGCGSA